MMWSLPAHQPLSEAREQFGCDTVMLLSQGTALCAIACCALALHSMQRAGAQDDRGFFGAQREQNQISQQVCMQGFIMPTRLNIIARFKRWHVIESDTTAVRSSSTSSKALARFPTQAWAAAASIGAERDAHRWFNTGPVSRLLAFLLHDVDKHVAVCAAQRTQAEAGFSHSFQRIAKTEAESWQADNSMMQASSCCTTCPLLS